MNTPDRKFVRALAVYEFDPHPPVALSNTSGGCNLQLRADGLTRQQCVGMRELDARLRVTLRHSATEQFEPITQLVAGPLTLDLLHHEASYRVSGSTSRPKSSIFSPTWPVTSGRSAHAE
jgi:hypothetical protein